MPWVCLEGECWCTGHNIQAKHTTAGVSAVGLGCRMPGLLFGVRKQCWQVTSCLCHVNLPVEIRDFERFRLASHAWLHTVMHAEAGVAFPFFVIVSTNDESAQAT